MNDILPNNISKLETLPNEVLIRVFEYIKPQDLKRGLWNLNSRLNSIINSCKICMTISNSRRHSDSQNQNDIEVFNVFASRLYSLRVDNFCNEKIDVDLSQCSQLRALEMSEITEEYITFIRPSVMPYLRRLDIDQPWFDRKAFLKRLLDEPFSFLTTMKFCEFKFRPKPEYKPIPYTKSLAGIYCMWDDFNSIFTVFPGLRRLHVSLYTYRENPRWASIHSFKFNVNNVLLEFSSEMVTPDDNPVFPLTINTRLRHVQLTASISKHNNNLLLINVLPQIVQRIENVIEQKTDEKLPAVGDLETSLEAHLACQNISWCLSYLRDGWGWIDTESC